MQFFYEIFPVLLFFIAFKYYGIYFATIVGIVTTFIQTISYRLYFKTWDKKQVITLIVFIVFGGMTLYFHNPIFVKWKPTIVYWLFAIIIFASQFTAKPIMKRLLASVLEEKLIIPDHVWTTLNMTWGNFFLILGGVNLYIAYYYSNDAWVNFKFYGVTSALLVVSVFQAIYLMRYMTDLDKNK